MAPERISSQLAWRSNLIRPLDPLNTYVVVTAQRSNIEDNA